MTVIAVDLKVMGLSMSMSIIDPLTEKAICTSSSQGFTSMTIPIVPLHMPWVIRELLRYMVRAPGCRRTEDGRFVFCLKMWFEDGGSHCAEFT